MRLKVTNNITMEKIDLGVITYTNEKIIDSNIENSLYDVYGRPSVYKKHAWNEIENDCQAVHGHGLHITSYNVNFFSTAFYVRLNGTLYKIVDTPSKRIAYTNDKRFDFTGVKVRVYGCRDSWTRDRVRRLVKPYLKAIGAKKARVDYIGMDDKVGFKFLVNDSHLLDDIIMTENELENFNIQYYKTYIKL